MRYSLKRLSRSRIFSTPLKRSSFAYFWAKSLNEDLRKISALHVTAASFSRFGYLLAVQMGLAEQLSEGVLLLSQFIPLFPPFLLCPLLDILLEHLLPLFGGQQEVSRIEHDLVQFFFPRTEGRDLLLGQHLLEQFYPGVQRYDGSLFGRPHLGFNRRLLSDVDLLSWGGSSICTWK